MRKLVSATRIGPEMYARDVDEAAAQLHELRLSEWENLGLAALAFGGALAATQSWRELAVPLFLGGLAVTALGMRALWRRWDVIDRLAGDRDAYVIPEVLAHASREATMERRRTFAAIIRATTLAAGDAHGAPGHAVAFELESLARELEDEALELDPPSAVACLRLLTDTQGSPLLDPQPASTDELRARIRHVRSGFRARRRAPETST
jgi:hypothetical protein